jgi:predicted DNA-binding antitoxin AbrB/MazE fold protein
MYTCKATYERGVFKPSEPISLPDGANVTLWVDGPGDKTHSSLTPEDREFFDGLAAERAEVFRRLAE